MTQGLRVLITVVVPNFAATAFCDHDHDHVRHAETAPETIAASDEDPKKKFGSGSGS